MARKATADNVRADMQPANFRAAVQVIRTIKAKTDRISGINGEIAAIHAKVEGFKVNKKAGRIFLVLDKLEVDERSDIMRSLNGLIDASGWDQEATDDLVDAAEGTSNVHRLPSMSGAHVGDPPDDLGDAIGDNPPAGDEIDDAFSDEFEASQAEIAAQKGRKDAKAAKAVKEAAPSAKAAPKKDAPPKASDPKPATGAAAIAAMKAASATGYTGDNSDLANPAGNA